MARRFKKGLLWTAIILTIMASALVVTLEDADVPVTYEEWEGMVHCWHGFTLFIPEARDAVRHVGEFIRLEPRSGTDKSLPPP